MKFRQMLFGDISVSDEELLAHYKMANDKVDLSYILIDKNLFADKVKIDPDEVKSFYDENKAGFFSPAKADIEYIEILYEDAAQKTATIDKVRDVYPEFEQSPEKFKETAEKHGLHHGRTGPFSRDELIPGIKSTAQLHDTAFALEEGEISRPVLSGEESGAAYILRKVQYIPPSPLEFEDVKQGIKEALADAASLRMAEEKATPLYEEITQAGMTLEGAGKINGQVVKTAKGINAKGYIQNIGPAGSIVTRALKSEEGKVIGPITVREKGVLLVRIDKITPADETEFEDKKETFRQNLLTRKQMGAMDKWFAENTSGVKLLRSLDEL
jgi:peptidyl-prolyl cis-trans isomerase D